MRRRKHNEKNCYRKQSSDNRKNEKYPETEILADLLCSASAVAKDVGVSKGMLLDCLMTAWDESNY